MKLIDKAWKMNLTFDEDKKYETKEEIIKYRCPKGEYYSLVKENDKMLCNRDSEKACLECWNREIDEDDKPRLTFEQLEKSPIKGLELEYKKHFEDSLKNNEEIVTVSYDNYSDIFTYDNLPIISKYLMDVYDYCTELKAKNIEYTIWCNARTHMEQGKRCKFKDVEYFIKNGELYWDFNSESKATTLTLSMLDSEEWILL